MNQKIKGYMNLARKANAVVIGSDNLEKTKSHIFLVITGADASESTIKISNLLHEKKACEIIHLTDCSIGEIIGIKKCQIIGITNQGFAKEIVNNLE